MKISKAVSAFIASLAPFAFAEGPADKVGQGLPAVKYQYGMKLDVEQVLYRTDNSDKIGVAPTEVVYRDTSGALHKIQFMEWGGRSSVS
ncbi:DUF2790 domain-containing protein [Pseudomonas matsuisoli]|uniref:DUF2790 domain-containing protein n=1 Tax=Pseudomonas matsuisoli TaxID=1515666 RepID=A0A917V1R6_9PSED|nr:DUF2790 domain-containing protein [Pseudomonas matsuisoli]GGK10060.1 hypothetical protein GCM10009304_40120 [Pseudomonas matsuisoli]